MQPDGHTIHSSVSGINNKPLNDRSTSEVGGLYFVSLVDVMYCIRDLDRISSPKREG